MSKFQYQLSGKKDREIWVCEACRNSNKEPILTGKWKLIDRRDDGKIKCALCEANDDDKDAGQAAGGKGA